MRVLLLIVLGIFTGCTTAQTPKSPLHECAMACKHSDLSSFEDESISCKCNGQEQ